MLLKYMLLFVMLFTALQNRKDTNEGIAVKIVGFSECGGACFISPASIFHTVDGPLTLLLPALHVRLFGGHG